MRYSLKSVLIQRGLLDRVEKAIQTIHTDSLYQNAAQDTINQFKFTVNNRPKTRFGCCRYKDRTIEVSGFHWKHGDTNEVDNTILHEVAHALAYFVFRHNGHGYVWKNIMVKLGCQPNRTGSYSSSEKMAAERVAKYTYACSDCGHEFSAYKRWRRNKIHTKCQHKPNIGRIHLKSQNY